jgi:hypothetical protein
MGATRTQVYLTKEQRRRLDIRGKREGKTLAALVREAIDAYLANEKPVDVRAMLDRTFGIAPDFQIPSRDEWDERLRRVYGSDPR